MTFISRGGGGVRSLPPMGTIRWYTSPPISTKSMPSIIIPFSAITCRQMAVAHWDMRNAGVSGCG